MYAQSLKCLKSKYLSFFSAQWVSRYLGRDVRSDLELEKFHFLHMLLCPALGGLIQREGLEKVCTVYLEDSTILEQLGFSADIAAPLSIPPPSLEHWKAYAKFYERRFFQRAWKKTLMRSAVRLRLITFGMSRPFPI
jgi:hypothetical protein